MKSIILLAMVLLQATIAAWLVSRYFLMTDRFARMKGRKWRVAEWGLFGLLVVTVVPVGLFFPIWFESVLPGESADKDGRLVLIVVGWVSLATSVWLGWYHSRSAVRRAAGR